MRCITDVTGTFQFQCPRIGEYTLYGEDGLVDSEKVPIAVPEGGLEDVEIRLCAPQEVAIAVLSSEGEPLAGAFCEILADRGRYLRDHRSESQTGHFLVLLCPDLSGRLITVGCPGYEGTSVTFTSIEEIPQVFELDSSDCCLVAGTMLGPGGRPIGGRRLQWKPTIVVVPLDGSEE